MCLQTPQAPSPGAITAQTLAAQLAAAPGEFNANSTYSPLYSQLSLDDLTGFLNGSPASTTSYAAVGKPGSKGYIPGGTTTTPGNAGFLSEYQNQIMPTLTGAETAANTQVRQANLNDATAMTPQVVAGERAANPGAAGLLDSLTSSANNELSYGTELTPEEQLQTNQSVRGASAARGMGFGPSDVFNESIADTGMGQQLLTQRQQTAQSLVPTLQSFYGDPFGEISGMGASGADSASGLTGAASGGVAPAQSSEFNPESALALQTGSQQFDSSVAGANNQNTWLTAPLSYGENL